MTILQVEEISKSFGGLRAVNRVSFQIDRGEITSIIGPNGAGKTTLFNLLTGHVPVDKGRIVFKDRVISGLPPHKICRRGIGRSFQRTNIFPRLNTFDNIQVAVMSWGRKTANIFVGSKKVLFEETNGILQAVGLGDKRNALAGSLSHGDQRRLEIGIALGSHPDLLLLDEPTAGMSPRESGDAIELIKRLGRERKLTILFIEHDMNVVFGISEVIRVMHMGQVIMEGTAAEVRSNEMVQKIYLSEES